MARRDVLAEVALGLFSTSGLIDDLSFGSAPSEELTALELSRGRVSSSACWSSLASLSFSRALWASFSKPLFCALTDLISFVSCSLVTAFIVWVVTVGLFSVEGDADDSSFLVPSPGDFLSCSSSAFKVSISFAFVESFFSNYLSTKATSLICLASFSVSSLSFGVSLVANLGRANKYSFMTLYLRSNMYLFGKVASSGKSKMNVG